MTTNLIIFECGYILNLWSLNYIIKSLGTFWHLFYLCLHVHDQLDYVLYVFIKVCLTIIVQTCLLFYYYLNL
jgi:hypothetical protein